MSYLWQHPYVNVFKHCKVDEWKKASKEGEVTSAMDKTIKATVYKVVGHIPAANYIQLPKTSTQSLGLTGRYLYLLFKPIPTKHFIVHLDVSTEENQVVRISFSSLFREFKVTATWLQFPFVCGSARGLLHEPSEHSTTRGKCAPVPMDARWTCLVLDLHYILSIYLNRRYSHLKAVRLCCSMLVRNLFTSDTLYQPGAPVVACGRSGQLPQGLGAMPREMAFYLPKGASWHDVYDFIRFPDLSLPDKEKTSPETKGEEGETSAGFPRPVSVSRAVRDRVSLVQQLTSPPQGQRAPTKPLPFSSATAAHSQQELFSASGTTFATETGGTGRFESQLTLERPESGFSLANGKTGCQRSPPSRCDGNDAEDGGDSSAAEDTGELSVFRSRGGDVHVVSSRSGDISVHRHSQRLAQIGDKTISPERPSEYYDEECSPLQPDPILALRRVIGFGGGTTRHALWTRQGDVIVYPCHAIIIAVEITTGNQRFLTGHSDKVTALTMNGASTLLASAQAGAVSLVRMWDFSSGECLSIFTPHLHALSLLSFSHSGAVLCGVGKDSHEKNTVVVWDTSRLRTGGLVSVVARTHTDVDLHTIKIASFDDTRMVSCGRGSVRLWRLRGSTLRSCPVDLAEFHAAHFTDVAFEEGLPADREPHDRTLFACSKSGHILEIDYKNVTIRNVRRLLPSPGVRASYDAGKRAPPSGPGIGINSMSVSEGLCATGSDDGFLRLWLLDFSTMLLEAEHEAPVSAVAISADGRRVLAATAGPAGASLGFLEVASRHYATLARSHAGPVLGCSADGALRHLVTVGRDASVRVWDSDSGQQLLDFSTLAVVPCVVCCHPVRQLLACGFSDGSVRAFSVASTALLAEHKQHRGQITALAFSRSGEFMYSACSLGSLAMYDASDDDLPALRVLGNVVATRGRRAADEEEEHDGDDAPSVLALSTDGQRLAFVGPSQDAVTVMDARSLEEVLRVSVSAGTATGHEDPGPERALAVRFAPPDSSRLLVLTRSRRIVILDAATGRNLRELSAAHHTRCVSTDVSEDGRFFATAGDRVVKVWDTRAQHRTDAQTFIGHSESVRHVMFTPDQLGLVSVGDAILIWDFLALPAFREKMNGRAPKRSPKKLDSRAVHRVDPDVAAGASALVSSLPILDVSSIRGPVATKASSPRAARRPDGTQGREVVIHPGEVSRRGGASGEEMEWSGGRCRSRGGRRTVVIVNEKTGDRSVATQLIATPRKRKPQQDEGAKDVTVASDGEGRGPALPYCHFQARRGVTEHPPQQPTTAGELPGLRLKAVIGYNGNGRGNLVWRPDNGLLAYSSGCVVVVEELRSGDQRHLLGHQREISTLAISHDAQTLVSASCGQMCMWDVASGVCRSGPTHHRGDVQALAFSRDDRFLLSLGDGRDGSLALWAVQQDVSLLASVHCPVPAHAVAFRPGRAGEFVCAASGHIAFGLVEQRGREFGLSLDMVAVPPELGGAEVTCVCYGAGGVVFAGTSSGLVSAWDSERKSCFLTWEADSLALGVLECRGHSLVTGGAGRRLRRWSVAIVDEARVQKRGTRGADCVVLEAELRLDASAVSAAFDDDLDMGVVGTAVGTVWFIGWAECSSMRLVSGHAEQVTGLAFSPDEALFASSAADGSLRVWDARSLELSVQFQVLQQTCECVAWSRVPARRSRFSRLVAAGYGDGAVRLFSLRSVEMVLKMRPHGSAVTALAFSTDGEFLVSGARDGLIAVSSLHTGATARVVTDHRPSPISAIDCVHSQHGGEMWLAASRDSRVSIWSCDWLRDRCDLVDWLTFPALSAGLDDTQGFESDRPAPPSLAVFCPGDVDTVVYAGYGLQREIVFYSLRLKQVVRKLPLDNWALSLDLSCNGDLIAVGTYERLVGLVDPASGRCRNVWGHEDAVRACRFSPSARRLFTAAHGAIFVWEVCDSA
ncbi:WD repeat-containing protein 90 isoform X1 [Lethenteron reissneri]|uniref:WD repeat-containing protein 90 isoform X1 n=1 Tax=Lethenteron reissneri TaxID=7753 RepID=UPI002AB6CBC7|nr:WD repeat-containing protein 90 isoform X1 [Lethenteron reissneri]